MVTKAFDQYRVYIYGYGGPRGRAMVAELYCYSPTGGTVGQIRFYPDGAEIPRDSLESRRGSEYIVLNMPMSRFEAIMSTIRQERPLHLGIDGDSHLGRIEGQGYLATTEHEPVGEEELA